MRDSQLPPIPKDKEYERYSLQDSAGFTGLPELQPQSPFLDTYRAEENTPPMPMYDSQPLLQNNTQMYTPPPMHYHDSTAFQERPTSFPEMPVPTSPFQEMPLASSFQELPPFPEMPVSGSPFNDSPYNEEKFPMEEPNIMYPPAHQPRRYKTSIKYTYVFCIQPTYISLL